METSQQRAYHKYLVVHVPTPECVCLCGYPACMCLCSLRSVTCSSLLILPPLKALLSLLIIAFAFQHTLAHIFNVELCKTTTQLRIFHNKIQD